MLDIRVDNLRKEFDGGNVVAVRDLNITFPAGTTTCLLGPSGCGKTTLMRIIAGLETATSGDVYFGDERVTDYPTRRRNIGMVFQYPVVYRGISVRDNIELPLKEEKLSKAERARRIDEVVTLLEMEESLHKDLSALDNGTRQKVAVARAVARQPRIILFDEPITNVDINAKLQLKRALKELFTRLNQTIIYVTHDQTEAMTLADKIALMRDGEIVQYASPRELYTNPDDVFGGWFLGNPGMNFFEGLFAGQNADGATIPIFAKPAQISGLSGDASGLTLGIRPEHVQVVEAQTPNAVQAQMLNKSIVVGGQYLLTLQVGDLRCKAKVAPEVGRRASGDVWVEFPIERIRLFGKDGHQPEATLTIIE
ncbi:MAG: ABC transporter ATP-binding protein [Caldilineaceae bacterium]